MRFCFLFFSIVCCFLFTFSYSQDSLTSDFSNIPDYPGKKKHFVGIRCYHENDIFAPGNTDDNYTGGLKFELITNLLNRFKKNKLLNPLKGNFSSLSFLFGLTVFTPREIKDSLIIFTDRPYASYRFWGFGVSSVSKDMNWKLYYELQLGSMGRPYAGKLQRKGHEFFNRYLGFHDDIPQGWPNQIAQPGCFTANLNGKLERKIFYPKPRCRKKNFNFLQISAKTEINLGQYLTNISIEPHISLLNWNNNFGEQDAPGIPSGFYEYEKYKNDTFSTKKTKNKVGFHLFIGARPKLVLHNATLTGRLGNTSVHTINSSELNNMVMEYNCGLLFRWCCVSLGYNGFARSREFSFQNKNLHFWGGIYIAILHRLK